MLHGCMMQRALRLVDSRQGVIPSSSCLLVVELVVSRDRGGGRPYVAAMDLIRQLVLGRR